MKSKTGLLLFLFFSISIYAQKVKVADKYFRDFAYMKAVELYIESLKKEDSSKHVLTRIGDCYYNNSNSEKANYWYQKAINNYDDVHPEYVYKYIQTLRSLGQYEEANTWLNEFKKLQKNGEYVRGIERVSLEKFQELSASKDSRIRVINLNSNTKYADFGGVEKDGTFFFTSSRKDDQSTSKMKIYKWNGEPFLNMYTSKINRVDSLVDISDVTPIASDNINLVNEHEGVLTMTKDGKTLYFTRNNVNKRKNTSYDKKGTSNLKIYRAQLQNDQWTAIEELPFNDKTFSTGHPALSPDEKTLFFVSDRAGGFGQTDIYKVAIRDDGSFGNVENLGEKINTEGREVFPFVAKDTTLYFSSDNHINLGLLDIFSSNILKKKTEEEVEVNNIGAPFNSGYDDFAFFTNPNGDSGYFSSNRMGGKGSDDIYAFDRYECQQSLLGTTYNKRTSEILPNTTVQLIDQTGKIISTTTSNEQGVYTFEEISCEKTYTVLASKKDFRSDNQQFSTSTVNAFENTLDIYLSPLIIDKEVVLNPIYFDFDKYEIRPDSAYELENLVNVMKDNPNMVIHIESHTDNRGSDRYNMRLSEKRANATKNYILSRGIDPSRVPVAVGYGESQLLHDCKRCTEKEHEENRRSIFKINTNFL
ncbi:OmpA family protein [Aquimarina sp. U1-2]|uniref:OmpA family protein n=1 Tax=Aquimarina sp. U1-2 TaxID=2823141 RepID=UPI001AECEC62|nr:OmpA family protein [Aquimarina sp. U1-2]MBP2833905.1 OmpA family protein [Aquimarina sp. U1-2]